MAQEKMLFGEVLNEIIGHTHFSSIEKICDRFYLINGITLLWFHDHDIETKLQSNGINEYHQNILSDYEQKYGVDVFWEKNSWKTKFVFTRIESLTVKNYKPNKFVDSRIPNEIFIMSFDQEKKVSSNITQMMDLKLSSLAKSRHSQIKTRMFKNIFEAWYFSEKKNTLTDFINFIQKFLGKDLNVCPEEKQIRNLDEWYQKTRSLIYNPKDINGFIYQKEMEGFKEIGGNVIEDIRKHFYMVFDNQICQKASFEEFYCTTEHRCYYCGVKTGDIEFLISSEPSKINTKRIYTRGRTLEVDRKSPEGLYWHLKNEDEKTNLVLSCYWCNNAKTDEYSEAEFIRKISPGITAIWENRLGKELDKPLGWNNIETRIWRETVNILKRKTF